VFSLKILDMLKVKIKMRLEFQTVYYVISAADLNRKVVLDVKDTDTWTDGQTEPIRHTISFCIVFIEGIARLCGLEVRVPGCRSRGPGSIPGATRFSEK
jgi:hypothetical protein